jgi:hypothetical protein
MSISRLEFENLLMARNKLLNIQNEIYDFEDERNFQILKLFIFFKLVEIFQFTFFKTFF